jgi:hypothetical protein
MTLRFRFLGIAAVLLGAPALVFLAPPVLAQDLYDIDTIRDLRLEFSQSNWWNLLDQNRQAETYIEADLEVDGVLYSQVGVRFKGNSSASVWPQQKMPFKIKMDEFVAGQDLLGYDTVNLGNSFMDPTFCREVLTYEVLRRWMPAPKSNYARLWLNDEYWGVYVNTQQVSGEFLDEWFEDPSGNRYKCDPVTHGPGIPPSTLVWVGPDPQDYQQSYQLKSNPTGSEWQDLVDMIDALNNGPLSSLWADAGPSLDLDRSLWFTAAQNLFVNRDSYIESRHNYYVYHDPHENRFSPIPWDVNEAFGNFGMGWTVGQLQRMSPTHHFGHPDYPLITRLLDSAAGPRGRDAYFAHYRDMLETEWNWAVMGPRVDELQNLIEADVQADGKKLYSMQDFHDNVTQDVTIGGGPGGGRISCGLKPFVDMRRSYLLGLPEFSRPRPSISGIQVLPDPPGASSPVLVLAEISVSGANLDEALLYWRNPPATLFTEETMFDDGQHGDGSSGDGLFGGVIPLQSSGAEVEWFLMASTTNGETTFEPVHGEERPHRFDVMPPVVPGPVVINEFLAINDSGAMDEAGEFEDWIELHNSSSSTLDLGGAFLADELDPASMWAIPTGTSIAPGGVLLVWADNDPGDGPLHATFKLDGDGERILLVDADGVTLRDLVDFDSQEADVSTGRLFDGDGPWVTFSNPSADALNSEGCGWRAYGPLDPLAPALDLVGNGTPSATGTVSVTLSGVTPGGSVGLHACFAPAYLDGILPGGTILVDPSTLFQSAPLTAGAGGAVTLTVPVNNPSLAGRALYLQALETSTGKLSPGLELVFCP